MAFRKGPDTSGPHSPADLTKVPGYVLNNVVRPIGNYIDTEVMSGAVLLTAALFALVWVNSPWDNSYADLFSHHISVNGIAFHIDEDVRHWINDGLMTLFFFVAGLEIKREVQQGELAGVHRVVLPGVAALGGMVAPAVIFFAINAGTSSSHGWGIPMATDIAFALGLLALLGRRVPTQLRTFLLALAIVDDIGAIIVIAIFYTGTIHLDSLAIAAALLITVYGVRVAGVKNYLPYVALGIAAWIAVFESGIHPTLTGVALGLLTPMGIETTEPEEQSILVSSGPLEELEGLLHPLTSFLIVPLFALANAGVKLDPGTLGDSATSSVTLGVALGLIIGKPLGIFTAAWLAVKSGVAQLPRSATWAEVLGIGVLGGVGFTVALFVNGLAFDSVSLQEDGRIGILAGSLLAGLAGFLVLFLLTRPDGSAPTDR